MNYFSKNYQVFNQFALRTPILPIETILQNCHSEEDIKRIMSDTTVQDAIYIASPLLLSEYKKYINGEIKSTKEKERILYSVCRYVIRMATRPTPFGLFSGCTTGEFTNNTEIILNDITNFKPHSRIDNLYLCSIINVIAQNNSIKQHLKYFPNTTIYKIIDNIRYVEYRFIDGDRSHHMVSVESNQCLEMVLCKSKVGLNIMELVDIIVKEEEVTIDEADEYINTLIQNQLLVSELEPSIAGMELLDQLIYLLKDKVDENDSILIMLKEIRNDIRCIDNKNIGGNKELYEKIEKKVNDFFKIKHSHVFFQVDLSISARKCTLDRDISQKILKALNVLNRLSSTILKSNLQQFISAFLERYDTQEIPLVEVLDTESGIGYLQNKLVNDYSPLIDDIAFNNKKSVHTIEWDRLQELLLKKYLSVIKNNQYEFIIDDTTIDALGEELIYESNEVTVIASIFNNKNNTPHIYMHTVPGMNAIKFFGRFCYASQEIYSLTKSLAEKQKEYYPNEKLAEIVHIPAFRTANILFRPALYDYEIPYLAKASVNNEFNINITDLLISVKNNRVILRSKSMNKEIIPKLSCAHDFSNNSLPIYNFLCDLETQDIKKDINFNWGRLSANYSFLPRVSYSNVILSPAIWRLNLEEYSLILSYSNSKDLTDKLLQWKENNKLSRYFCLADGDNQLFIDSENLFHVKSFIDVIKKRSNITIVESFFEQENSIVKSADRKSSYVNQFVISFLKNNKEDFTYNPSPIRFGNNLITLPQRTFIVGDEWLYYKIYIGVVFADFVLSAIIKPLTESLLKEQRIDKWFFIRYADPGFHLRIRFHLINKNETQTIIDRVNEFFRKYVLERVIWRIEIGTYERELERYGSSAMSLAETLFFYDSICVVDLINLLVDDEKEKNRWLLGVKMIDNLLTDFKFGLEVKSRLITTMRRAYGMEYFSNNINKMQLDVKYRKVQRQIQDIVKHQKMDDTSVNVFFDIIKSRSIHARDIIDEINNIKLSGQLDVEIFSLMMSLIHMTMNRLFKSRQRIQEVVVYDFLSRYYHSELMQQKYGR